MTVIWGHISINIPYCLDGIKVTREIFSFSNSPIPDYFDLYHQSYSACSQKFKQYGNLCHPNHLPSSAQFPSVIPVKLDSSNYYL